MADDQQQNDQPIEQETVAENSAPEVQETEPAVVEEAQPVEEQPTAAPENPEPKNKNPLKNLLPWAKTHKKISIPAAVVLLLALLTAIPPTRYLLPGTFYKANYQVAVIDNATHKPVSNATVTLDGKTAITGNDGKATVKARVGKRQLKVTKNYYKDQTAKVVVGFSNGVRGVGAEATGRQVPVTVKNKINGAPVANLTFKALGAEATTGADGKVTIVLPAGKTTVDATITGKGYNQIPVTIQVTEQAVTQNDFTVTPAGKLYFLSKQSGKIDVVKTDLDGQNRQTVLAGTSNEDDFDTILLASRDWRFLALKSKRDDKPKLYLIDTSTDKLTTIDEGDATFTPIGWYNDNFVYDVNRNGLDAWQPKQQALKSFNATSGKLLTLDETDGEGSGGNDYARENIGSIYILENQVLYTKTWEYGFGHLFDHPGKKDTFNSIRPDGSGKVVLKSVDASGDYGSLYVSAVSYGPQSVYYQLSGASVTYLKYEAGKLQDTAITSDTFNKPYPTFLVSPSGQQTFWYDARDGKNTLLVGDSDGQNGKELASLTDYTPYGWYGSDYLLVSKNNSELYILPVTATSGAAAIKVSDYHKPNYDFRGYGYGYGGN